MSPTLPALTSLLAALVLLGTVLGAGSRRLDTRLLSYRLQSLALGLFAATLAAVEGRPHLYLAAGIALGLKWLALPRFFAALARRHRPRAPIDPGGPRLVLAAGLVAALVERAAGPVALALPGTSEGALPLAAAFAMGLAGVAVSLLAAARDRDPVFQFLGLATLENCVALTTFAVSRGRIAPFVLVVTLEAALALVLRHQLEPLVAGAGAIAPAEPRRAAAAEGP
jgi:hydrogenase-4 membrane subunit HyfE